MCENHQHARPTEIEARDLLEVARLGARAAGAKRNDVEDVAQITAEKLTRKWGANHVARARARGPDAWHAYIAVTARYALLDLYRGRSRATHREQQAAGPAHTRHQPPRPGVVRPQPDRPSDVERYLSRRVIVDLIDECIPNRRERDVAALTFIDGLTTYEIATELHLSTGAVNRYKRAAIAKLEASVLSQRQPQKRGISSQLRGNQSGGRRATMRTIE